MLSAYFRQVGFKRITDNPFDLELVQVVLKFILIGGNICYKQILCHVKNIFVYLKYMCHTH